MKPKEEEPEISQSGSKTAKRKRVLVIDLHHWPCLEWFALAAAHEEVWLEAHESFHKQTCRNRCYVLSANGPERLTVPTVGSPNAPYAEIVADERQGWRRKHWRTLRTAYGKAPFFEHYAPELAALYEGPPPEGGLFALNEAILSKCLRWLGLDLPIRHTGKWQKEYGSQDDSFLQVHDQRNLTDCQKSRLLPDAIRYIQTFGNEFVPNLSILDLLLCEGPQSGPFVRKLSARLGEGSAR